MKINKDGTTKEFRAHPMTKSKKLCAGDTGPLELTFFLNSPLSYLNLGLIEV